MDVAKKAGAGVGEMVQQLRACSAVVEDQGLVPRTRVRELSTAYELVIFLLLW